MKFPKRNASKGPALLISGYPALKRSVDTASLLQKEDGKRTKEIEDTWYLYASELEEAYENAGCGDNPRENNGMAAIYYYISEKVNEWYHDNAEDIFERWASEQLP